MAETDEENYGSKERGFVQPYDDYIDQMISYIDNYALDEPTIEARRKMLKDAQVKAVVEMLKESVLSSGWEIHYNFDKDKEVGQEMVAMLYEHYNRINEQPWSAGGIEDLIEKMMDALWFKKSTTELVFEHDPVQEYIFIKKAKVLPPESIRLPCDHLGNLLQVEQYPYNIETQYLKTGNYATDGIDPIVLDINKVLLWVNGDDYSQFEGKSELDSVYKYWFLKDFILKFWSMYVERFGAPLLIAFVKAKNMKQAREGLKNIITETSFALEKDDKMEIVEPKKEGEVFKMMISYCDNEITKGLLMPTAVYGDIEGGSKGLGELQFKFFEYRVQFIQRKVQNLIRALTKKDIDLNFPNVTHYPVFTFKPLSVTQRRMMAQTFDLLVKNALIHPLEPWIRKELQLPEVDPTFYDDLDLAWKAKMSAGSQQIIDTPTPVGDVSRTEAQTNQRQPAPVGEQPVGEFAEPESAHDILKRQLEAGDEKLNGYLIPTVQSGIKRLIKTVQANLEKDSSVEYTETPLWLKNLKFEMTGFSEGMNTVFDEVLIDISIDDNKRLTQLGMKSSFDVNSRSGAFRWIDQRMAAIKNSLYSYGDINAQELELRILEDTKALVQKGLNEGLRGRDITTSLQEGLLGSRYSRAQLETVVRTNTTAIVNQGKKGFARANKDFVKGMQFVAILDKGTTDICEQRDGKVFALNDPALDTNTPPLHFSCRSVLDYLIDGSPKFNPSGIDSDIPTGFGGDI